MQDEVYSAGDRRPLSGIRVMVTRPTVADGPHPLPAPVVARSPDRAAPWHGQETVPQQGLSGGADIPVCPIGRKLMDRQECLPHRDDPLAGRLRELGAEVVVQPAIRISPPPDWQPVDDALARLPEYDWLVFSSRTAFGRFGAVEGKGGGRSSPLGGDGTGHGR